MLGTKRMLLDLFFQLFSNLPENGQRYVHLNMHIASLQYMTYFSRVQLIVATYSFVYFQIYASLNLIQ